MKEIERMSEDMPERMSERMSEDMTERLSERLSGYMQRMSEEMSERMSEDMPEIMPQDFLQSVCEALVSTWWIRVQQWSVLVSKLQTFVPHWVWAPNGVKAKHIDMHFDPFQPQETPATRGCLSPSNSR